MSEAPFAAAARRLSGLAGVAAGWSPDLFWSATPADLVALVDVLAGRDDAAVPPDAAALARLKEAFPDE